jgi:hypothetical protein
MFTSGRRRSGSSGSASPYCRTRCGNSPLWASGTNYRYRECRELLFQPFGQLIYKEPRGKLSGYKFREVGIHRGRLHFILFRAALAKLSAAGLKH